MVSFSATLDANRVARAIEATRFPPGSDHGGDLEPAVLHRVTLQGYFGETLGIIAVEHWGAHGHSDWVVPAFLFRFNDQEFQHLELINARLRRGEMHDPDEATELRPGRTGDDGLAFRMSPDGAITDVLSLEAKCLARNSNVKIEEAHSKLAAAGPLPSGIRELINILADYNTPDANRWQEALIKLRAGRRRAVRFDGVAYACGRVPTGKRVSWLGADRADGSYAVRRGLEALEFQFADLPGVIDLVYRRP
jgi:hypothetical protein